MPLTAGTDARTDAGTEAEADTDAGDTILHSLRPAIPRDGLCHNRDKRNETERKNVSEKE